MLKEDNHDKENILSEEEQQRWWCVLAFIILDPGTFLFLQSRLYFNWDGPRTNDIGMFFKHLHGFPK